MRGHAVAFPLHVNEEPESETAQGITLICRVDGSVRDCRIQEVSGLCLRNYGAYQRPLPQEADSRSASPNPDSALKKRIIS